MRTLFRVCFLILLLAIIEIVCAGISALGVFYVLDIVPSR